MRRNVFSRARLQRLKCKQSAGVLRMTPGAIASAIPIAGLLASNSKACSKASKTRIAVSTLSSAMNEITPSSSAWARFASSGVPHRGNEQV